MYNSHSHQNTPVTHTQTQTKVSVLKQELYQRLTDKTWGDYPAARSERIAAVCGACTAAVCCFPKSPPSAVRRQESPSEENSQRRRTRSDLASPRPTHLECFRAASKTYKMARDFGEVCEEAVCEVKGSGQEPTTPRTRAIIATAARNASAASILPSHSVASATNTYTPPPWTMGGPPSPLVPHTATFSDRSRRF